ncbi:flagellar protein FlgN [Thermobrachium celere]|nr:flagellar protein FlgN [Thermobrachium celere]
MIKEIIIQQINMLNEVNKLLDIEIDVLKKDEASKLVNIVEEKKKLMLELSKLEKKRRELCSDKGSDELISEGLISADLIDQLKAITYEVKEKNELCLLLTKQSLGYIKMFNNMLSQGNRVVTYKDTGKLNENVNSIFTTKI